jgi:tetratricopeptide (TPR) repeat protein
LIVSEPRSRRRLGLSLLALALASVAGGPARGQTSTSAHEPEQKQEQEKEGKRAAQDHLTRGNDLFTHDRYAGALEEFQAAFAAFPSPKLQFNLGQCERALGHDGAAIDHFQRFLDEAKDVSPALRAEAQRYLAETRAHAADARARGAPATAPTIVAPLPTPVTPAPPPAAPSPPVTTPALEAPHLIEAAPAQQRRSLGSRWWLWTAVGVLAVGAAASVFLLTRPRDPACGAMRCYQ